MNRYYDKEKLIRNLLMQGNIKIGDIFYYDKVTSTMDVAANLNYDSLKDLTVIISDEQTQGRGRYRRKWYGSGEDCMFSIVLKDYDFTIPYSLIASLGVYKVLSPLSQDLRLKWINDVFWGPKKISGILTEEKNNRTTIGVGVNVNSSKFPSNIINDVTSLYLETGIIYDRINYFVKLIKSIMDYIYIAHRDGVEKLLKLWEKASKMRGVMVRVNTSNGAQSGIVQGINYKTGALIIKDGNKIKELYDGTLSFV